MKHANIALFVPHVGCPHLCSFCDQKAITGQTALPQAQDVINAAETALASLGSAAKDAEFAFFGGSFTAIPRDYMLELLDAAAPYAHRGELHGIRVSTRPDAVNGEILTLLQSRGVTAVELGAQSMDDRVLALNGRGHTAAQTEQAAALVHGAGLSLGLQMMTGLPGDTPEGAKETARQLAALKPDTMRIYPTVVMEGTLLAQWYRDGTYQPMELEQAVELCAGLLAFFDSLGIPVIRLGLHSTPELDAGMLAGPYHPAFRQLCQSRRILNHIISKLPADGMVESDALHIRVNPRELSDALGQKRCNALALAQMGVRACFLADPDVPLGGLGLEPVKNP